jgi:hypothetical protein
MKQAPWILFAGALLYILFLQMCNKPAASVPKSQFDELEKKYLDTLEGYYTFRRQSDSSLENATASAIQANERAEQSQEALDQERQKVGRLLVMLDEAEKETPDSTWVHVSPRYKMGCDSLRKANLTLNYRILDFQRDAQAEIGALSYKSHLQDSLLQRERGFNAEFRRQLDDCITTGKQQEKASRPRTKLYGGIAIWGNQFTPLGGGEINLSIKTPRDQMYELKGAYINGWWVGAGTKFKFSLK